MDRPDWDDQFAETEEEVRERWRCIKDNRRSQGKCWQCAMILNDIGECDNPGCKASQ